MAGPTATTNNEAPQIWGMMAEFPDVKSVYHAAQKMRDAGYTKWDVGCPFPIHNMDEAMGLKRSKVAWVMGTGAFSGVCLAMLLQGWTSGGGSAFIGWLSGYPMVTAGKPYVAWEQFMPVIFELGVLLSAFGALMGMLAFNKLPMWYHPLLKRERYMRVSDDKFFVSVECADAKYDEGAMRRFFEELGATHIEMVEA